MQLLSPREAKGHFCKLRLHSPKDHKKPTLNGRKSQLGPGWWWKDTGGQPGLWTECCGLSCPPLPGCRPTLRG